MKFNKEHRFLSGYLNFAIKVDLPDVKSFDEEMYKFEELKKTRILLEGCWRERRFYVGKNKFCEPVAYVEVLPTDANYLYDFANDYTGIAYWLPKDQQAGTWYTGFDHGHSGDYSPYNAVKYGDTRGYKWPLVEILMEVAALVDEIEESNRDPSILD